jgi:Iap family predicted aminopeptidase
MKMCKFLTCILILLIFSFTNIITATPVKGFASCENHIIKTNLKKHVNILENCVSRHINQPGNIIAMNYIIHKLYSYGYKPKLDMFITTDGQILSNVRCKYNVKRKAGKRCPVILLSAHFDSISSDNTLAPGADDNASGVAALLEIARLIKKNKINKSFELVFFNCEEVGTQGSKHLAEKYKNKGWDIDYMINIDTIGTWKGALSEECPVNYVTDDNSRIVTEHLKKYFSYPLKECPQQWRDDHGNFWDQGYKAIEITEDGVTEYMHTPEDTSEKLNFNNIAKITQGVYNVIINDFQPTYNLKHVKTGTNI